MKELKGRKNLVVWLVDDDDIFRYTAERILKKGGLKNIMGYECAESALEDLKKNHSPDIILLDINMPAMDGWEFLEAYAQGMPKFQWQCRIFVVSSSVYEPDQAKASSHPYVSDYLCKPLSVNHVEEILGVLQLS